MTKYPPNWYTRNFGDLFRIKHGYAFKGEYFSSAGTYILLTPGNFYEEGGFRLKGIKEKYYTGEVPNDYILQKDDLIIAMTEQAIGLLGSAAIIPSSNRYLHNQRLGLITDLDPQCLDKYFLYHLFNSTFVREQVQATASGTKVRHTSPDRIASINILLPPLLEQRKIAEILNTWDGGINLIVQLIAALNQHKQALIQLLLTGKVRHRKFIECYEQQDTPFGKIPTDWEYTPLSEIAKQVLDKNKTGESYPVLSCTKHNGLVDSLEYFGRQMFSEDLSTYKIVSRGQFAYATNHIEEGSIGYQDLYEEALISPMYTVFETTERVNDKFLYAVLKTELYRQIFERSTSASVNRRGSLRWNEFSKIKIPLPSIKEQKDISDILDTSDQIIKLYSNYLEQIRKQKRSLMHQLLAGQVRVNVDS